MRKGTLSAVSYILMICLIVGLSFYPQTSEVYAGGITWQGEGTTTSPYAISTAADLAKLATAVSDGAVQTGKYFKLMGDIDISSYSNWAPIGTEGYPFQGNFDGGQHMIAGLTFNPSTIPTGGGLFAFVSGSSITELSLTGVSITVAAVQTYEPVGALVGTAINSTIASCSAFGSVYVNGYNVGGLIGSANASTISACSATVDVSGRFSVGGLIGRSDASTISRCYADGVTSAYFSSGGLVGYLASSSIINCYATGKIIAGTSEDWSYAGGLVGNVGSNSTILSSYAIGSISASGIGTSGLVGAVQISSSVSGSFYNLVSATSSSRIYQWIDSGDDEVLVSTPQSIGTSTTTTQMQTKSTFTDASWDFTNVWAMTNNAYPVFIWKYGQLTYNEESSEPNKPAPTPTGNLYYSLLFQTDGGSSIYPARVASGQSVPQPRNPAKAGYTFGGWYQDAEFTQAYNFDSTIQHNTWIFAKWTPGIDKSKLTLTLNIGKPNSTLKDVTGFQTESNLDIAPVIKNSRTLLPIRYVVEPFGGTVSWDQSQRMVTITKGDVVIQLWIDKSVAKVNGKDVMIDSENANVMPIIMDPGRTMLPIRFIAENLGLTVQWDQNTQQVTVQN